MAITRRWVARRSGVSTAPHSKLRRIFADHVRARRKELGISQEELADRAGLHRTFIGAVARAETNVSIDNIARISAALEVEASTLLELRQPSSPIMARLGRIEKLD